MGKTLFEELFDQRIDEIIEESSLIAVDNSPKMYIPKRIREREYNKKKVNYNSRIVEFLPISDPVKIHELKDKAVDLIKNLRTSGLDPAEICEILKSANSVLNKTISQSKSEELERLSTRIGEIWKNIEGCEGLYAISNLGRIRNMKKNTTTIGALCPNGYLRTSLRNKNRKNFYVHDLVAEAFLTKPNSNEKFVVDHINEDKIDNRSSNLQYLTYKQNSNKGTSTVRKKVKLARQVRCIETGEVFFCIKDAEKSCIERGLPFTFQINSVLNNPNKTAYGCHWEHV